VNCPGTFGDSSTKANPSAQPKKIFFFFAGQVESLIPNCPGFVNINSMNSRPKTAADLVNEVELTELALPSNIRYGEAIYSRGAVEFIKFTDSTIEAWVGGLDGTVIEGAGSRRRTQFFLNNAQLGWHCSGNPKNHQIFCKHCVGLALAVLNKQQ
jgi:uncharacterized Zn finger protein